MGCCYHIKLAVDQDKSLSLSEDAEAKALVSEPDAVLIKGDKGDPGTNGKDGINGKDGVDGKNGADGRTPIKGTDYFTEADKAEMVSAVISALPKYNGEVVAE